MPATHNSRHGQLVDECVEALCQKGCKEVTAIIAALEEGAHVPETRRLGEAARRAVLSELKSIMAVYDGACPQGSARPPLRREDEP